MAVINEAKALAVTVRTITNPLIANSIANPVIKGSNGVAVWVELQQPGLIRLRISIKVSPLITANDSDTGFCVKLSLGSSSPAIQANRIPAANAWVICTMMPLGLVVSPVMSDSITAIAGINVL